MSEGRASNVVLICLDTLRYDCVGLCPDKTHLRAWGAEHKLHTPNLDAFFAESLYFTRARATAPYTTASHASVMTGLYPNHHGVRPFYKWALAEGVGTLAEELRNRGHGTVALLEGRSADNVLTTGSEILRGFDAFFPDKAEAACHCRATPVPHLLFLHTFDVHEPYCWSPAAGPDQDSSAWDAMEKEIYRRVGLERPPGGDPRDKKEFHSWACAEFRRRLGDRQAARLMLDWYIRGVNWFDETRWPRIVAALRDAGLYDDALIIVFADHGEAMLPDFLGAPMGHTPSVLEDALRVPLAVRVPGIKPQVVTRQVSLVDVAPTVLSYLGLDACAVGRSGRLDGQSLLAPPENTAGRLVCHFSEAWRTHWRAGREGKDWWRGQVDDPCEPYQVCVKCDKVKLLWHPGAAQLRRYMRPKSRLRALVRTRLRRLYHEMVPMRALFRRLLPARTRQWVRGGESRLGRVFRRRRDAPKAPAQHGVQRDLRWREAPVFITDLSEDPLERRPRRVNPAALVGVQKDLLDRLKEYWEDGVQGPQIRLGDAEADKVMQNLRDLGYVD